MKKMKNDDRRIYQHKGPGSGSGRPKRLWLDDDGHVWTVYDLMELTGLRYSTLYRWLNTPGWTVEKVIEVGRLEAALRVARGSPEVGRVHGKSEDADVA